ERGGGFRGAAGARGQQRHDRRLDREPASGDGEERERPLRCGDRPGHATLACAAAAGSSPRARSRGSARCSALVFRTAAATNAATSPIVATTPPTSNRRTGAPPNGSIHGDVAPFNAPAASTMRSSVGPKPRNDIRKTPPAA